MDNMVTTSEACKTVLRLHENLPDTPVNISGGQKLLQMLPVRPEAKIIALRCCKNILRCSWK